MEQIIKSAAPNTVIKLVCFFSSLPNEMHSAIHELYSTDRKGTLPSVWIEQIVKPSAPTLSLNSAFFLSPPNEMQYTIRKLYSTERKATNNPYGSNGSLSLSPPPPPPYVKGSNFLVSLMRCNIRSVNCTLWSVRPLYNPYGSNGPLSLSSSSLCQKSFFLSLPNEMQYTIHEEYSMELKAT